MAQMTITAVAIAAAALLMPLLPAGGAGAAAVGDRASLAPAIPIGMPSCLRSCGGVDAPYPFGIGTHARCYLPGFNLTCHITGRLLLDAHGTLQVLWIDRDAGYVLLKLAQRYSDVDAGGNGNGSRGLRHTLGSYRSELIPLVCNVEATMKRTNVTEGISNVCHSRRTSYANDVQSPVYDDLIILTGRPPSTKEAFPVWLRWEVVGHTRSNKTCKSDHSQLWKGERRGGYTCTCKEGYHGNPYLADGCKGSCRTSYGDADLPYSFGGSGPWPTTCETWPCHNPPRLLLGQEMPLSARHYLPSQHHGSDHVSADVTFPFTVQDIHSDQVQRDLCKSKHSHYDSCQCDDGYHGNPYVPNGCKGGHAKSFEGIRIIIGVAAGAGLILLSLIAYFISYKFKHWRAQMLKRKHVQRNRGKLLQRLAPQRADIAEKSIITLEEIEKATNNFDKAHELGGGGHGMVYKAILSDLNVVAIKKPKMVVQSEIEEFINEIAILSQINHRNIIKLYGCCLETEVPMLVYEFISNGSLYHHLHVDGPKSLAWDVRLRIAIETARSLAYLHSGTSTPIIHRDVKPANILLDDTLTAKLADFGASRYIPLDRSELTTMAQGTLGYMDPTYFYTWRLTKKSDVYSFGVMLIEMMTRKKPLPYTDSEGNGLVAHFASLFAEGNLMQILDPQVITEGGNRIQEIAGIAVACVKLQGEERPTMRQVELRLEAAQSPEFQANVDMAVNSPLECNEGFTSRQYSMEEEYILSARYPR